MVGITDIRKANAAFAGKGVKGLVGVFVGATAGIGEVTMRHFVKNTVSPRVYFVGRSQESGDRISTELKKLNPSSQIQFLKADTTELGNVDVVTKEIMKKEEKCDLLVLSPGYMTMAGRDESPEGLDRKMVVSYYGRLRFITNLLPLLSHPTSTNPRVISILAPGREGQIVSTDLDLTSPENFTLRNVELHTTTFSSLALEHLSLKNPNISFIHANPGIVTATGLMRGLPVHYRYLVTLAKPLISPFSIGIEESGESFFWLGTDERFRRGYWGIDWKGDSMDPRVGGGPKGVVNWIAGSRKTVWWGEEVREKVWKHTLEVFGRVGNTK